MVQEQDAVKRVSIPLARPLIGEAEVSAVTRVLNSRHIASGPETALLEKEVSSLLGGNEVVAVSSGGAALLLALKALGIKAGDEVVVPAFTFPAAAQAALWLGAVPIPADVDPETLAVNAETVRARLSPHTRAIVVAHAFGIPADIEAVVEVGRTRGVAVIEDAACALGGRTLSGLPLGTIGDAGCFSLHPRKAATSGEGGLVTASHALAGMVRRLRDYGRAKSGFGDVFETPGLNFRLSDIGAAVGRVQVGKLEKSLKKRAALVRRYREKLDGCVEVPRGYDHPGNTFQSLVVRVPDGPSVVKALADLGVEAGPAAYDLCAQAFFRNAVSGRWECPCAARMAHTLIALPLFDEMKEEEVDLVCEAIEGVMKWKMS